MALIGQLKLSRAASRSDRTPVGKFRRRLLEAIDLQTAMAEAELKGEAFAITKKVWVRGERGEKQLKEKPQRASRWWWTAANGTTFLEIKLAGRSLELAPGKAVIEVGAVEELPKHLSLLREAVESGELDKLAENRPTSSKTIARGYVPKKTAS